MGGETEEIGVHQDDITYRYHSLKDWLLRRDQVTEMEECEFLTFSIRSLDEFAFFWAKTLDKLCKCMIRHEQVNQ